MQYVESELSSVEYGRRIEAQALAWFLDRFPDAIFMRANYRCKVGEIDLIFRKGDELVFVEVRARGRASWQDGIESVDFRKRRKLLLAIRHYLAGYRGAASGARLDILAWDGEVWRHVPNVWY